jgi:hypothetical protein
MDENTVDFGRTVLFLGRNGCFNSVGLHVVDHPTRECVGIFPVTSRGKLASCEIEIPVEKVPEVVESLLRMMRQTVLSARFSKKGA